MSTALDVSIKALYVQGLSPDVDQATSEQLKAASSELHITTIAGSAAALAELRRTPGWQALLASPSLPQNEVLALITSLRRDRIPIAIVPIVDDSRQDLFASAVASGADDVLVRRAGTLVNVNETLARIRQSPHLFPAEQRRRIAVLYAGRDPLVWNLLDQVPFVKADRVTVGIDGACPVRRPGAADGSLRADAVIIDEQPGEAHPLQVLKSVKAQATDLPVIVLTSAGAADIATAALELGADDTVLKTGIFRRRLIATLRRVHQRLELTAQQLEIKAREERLRQIVENVPTGIVVVAASGNVLAMNAAGLQLFGATRPREVVGRDFRQLVAPQDQDAITNLIRTVTKGEPASASFEAVTLEGGRVPARIQAVVLERDARGGRGVVANITRADQPVHAAEADNREAELGDLRDALQRMEQHFAELQEARTREQAAWETERRQLEARLEEAERIGAERAVLEARLEEVTAELTRASRSFAEERQVLEARLQELEAAAREAAAIGATKAELERALSAVREEQRQAVTAHALERSGWQEIRSELEARVRDLDSTLEDTQAATIAALHADMRNLEQTLAEERARWDATRAQLEAELRNAREALWAEHNERDAARAAADAELARLRDEAASRQSAWDDTRASLEQAIAEAREAAETAHRERDDVRTRLEQELHDVRSGLAQEARRAHEEAEVARRERDETRASLEQEMQRLRAELDREQAAWNDRRAALEAELRRASDAEEAYKELVSVRSRLEAELEEARQQVALERGAAEASETRAREEIERAEEATRALADEYDATRARLEQEREEARRALETERQAWDERRAQLEADLAGVSNQAQIIQQRLEDERRVHESVRAERDEAVQRIDGLIAERDEAMQRAQTLTAERDEAQRRVEALTAELDEVRRLVSDREAIGAALDDTRRERDEAVQRAETLLAERDDAQRHVEALTAELEEARRLVSDREAIDATLQDARRERDEAQRRVEALTSDLEDARRLAGERDALAAALEAARNEIRHTDEARRADRIEWDQTRQDFERQLRDAHAEWESERAQWQRTRSQLEAELRETARLGDERQRLDEALTNLRNDYASLVETLGSERAQRDEDLRGLESLRAALAAAESRQQDLDEALDRAARSAEEQLARQVAQHESEMQRLKAELQQATDRLEETRAEAERTRHALHADYERASESHTRLIASNAFGYAVTTLEGRLVRCNDAFARMFGFADAADALTRTTGRLFPALSNRPEIADRLSSEGRIDQVASCVERIDGRAIRIVETAVVIADPAERSGDETLVEHVIIAGQTGPSTEEIQGSRMQEVGALATAMVPEIESLVATTHERAVELARRSADRRVLPSDVEPLHRLATRIDTLVRQLAAFSRRQVRAPQSLDLGDAIVRAEPMLERLVGDYINFSTDVGPTTPISAQPEDLDQLLTSLTTHARDLLPAGGSIVVRARQEESGIVPGDPTFGMPGPVLSIAASGYGAQHPDALPALDLVAVRCGGRLHISAEAGWLVRLEVLFPRCGVSTRPRWDWLAE